MTLLGGVASIACSGGTRSVFRPSDPAFTPRVGENPVVYLHHNIEDVPKQRMRSVGLIEVTVPNGAGIDRAVDAAAKKGSELGCWILIEHSVFAALESRASLDHGATVILAHGPGLHIGRQPSPTRERSAQFDCVVQVNTSAEVACAAHHGLAIVH
ncbi:MAG: hypothetical protein WKG01_10745 [Kofleriaceae bacterium]